MNAPLRLLGQPGDQGADRGEEDQGEEPVAPELYCEERDGRAPAGFPPAPWRARWFGRSAQLALGTMSPLVAVLAAANRACTSAQFTISQKAFT